MQQAGERATVIVDEKQLKKWIRGQALSKYSLQDYQKERRNFPIWMEANSNTLRVQLVSPLTIPEDAVKNGIPAPIAGSLLGPNVLGPKFQSTISNDQLISDFLSTISTMFPSTTTEMLTKYKQQYFNVENFQFLRYVYQSQTKELRGNEYIRFKKFIIAILHYRGKLDYHQALEFVEHAEVMQELLYAVTNWSFYIKEYELAIQKKKVITTSEKDYETYETMGDKAMNHAITVYATRRYKDKMDLYGNEKLTDFVKSAVSATFVSKLAQIMGLTEYIQYTPAVFIINPYNSVVDKENGDKIAIQITKKMKTDTFEAFHGCIETLLDKYVKFGIGYPIVYNILSSLLDEMGEEDITFDINKNKDSISKFKELFEHVDNIDDPFVQLKEQLRKEVSVNGKKVRLSDQVVREIFQNNSFVILRTNKKIDKNQSIPYRLSINPGFKTVLYKALRETRSYTDQYVEILNKLNEVEDLRTYIITGPKKYEYFYNEKNPDYKIENMRYLVHIVLSIKFFSSDKPDLTFDAWAEDIQDAKKKASSDALDTLSKSPYNMVWIYKGEE